MLRPCPVGGGAVNGRFDNSTQNSQMLILTRNPGESIKIGDNIKITIALTLLILLFSNTLNAEEQNYCNDPDTNMQQEALVQENPDDMQIHALYALRLGLCFEVDRGDLTVDQATEIFENNWCEGQGYGAGIGRERE